MKKFNVIATAVLLMISAASMSHAIVGVGVHYGFDLSMSMKNVDEAVSLKLPDGISELVPAGGAPFSVSGQNWKASPINVGGKVYVDIIPVIDAIEVSCNFGLWQYDGALTYINPNPTGEGDLYKTIPLTINEQGLNYIGLGGTPYAKLLLDASVRKTLLDLVILKFSAGAGVSVHFATPLLSASLVEDVFGKKEITKEFLEGLGDKGNANSKAIVEKIIDETLGEPVYGAHIIVGAQFKFPVIPVGLYVDGKYMLPFTKFDEDKNISGFGFLVNAGISLSI
jgi:hypothetical protein